MSAPPTTRAATVVVMLVASATTRPRVSAEPRASQRHVVRVTSSPDVSARADVLASRSVATAPARKFTVSIAMSGRMRAAQRAHVLARSGLLPSTRIWVSRWTPRTHAVSVGPSGPDGVSGRPPSTIDPVNGSEPGPKKPAGIGLYWKSSYVMPLAGVTNKSDPAMTLHVGSGVTGADAPALFVSVTGPDSV